MPRIRTIKPEFWTDDLLGAISREARLLFIASWNIADDEGLLRWTAPTLKGAVFPFDDDIGIQQVEAYMRELEEADVIFPYVGGRSQQKLAYIVNFLKHQKINRPSPSRLPPPPLQSQEVRYMYARRDGWMCHLCGGRIDEKPTLHNEDFCVSVDHLKPVSQGGDDYPSNIKAAHITCNKGRGNRSREEYMALVMSGKTVAQIRYPERFTHVVVSNSVSDSVTEEEQGTGKGITEEDKKEPAAPRFEEEFEEFWEPYPKKADRGHALKAFISARKRGIPLETLIEGARRYRDKPDRDPKFTKNAQGWLSGECWNDEAAQPPPKAEISPEDRERRQLEGYAALIRKGLSPGQSFTPAHRFKLLKANMVTPDECDRAGCAA